MDSRKIFQKSEPLSFSLPASSNQWVRAFGIAKLRRNLKLSPQLVKKERKRKVKKERALID